MGKNKKNNLPISTILSIVSMLLFIVKTVNSFMDGAEQGGASGIIKFAVIPLIIAFAICFAVTVIANIKNNQAVKESIGDTKYNIKTTKNVVAIMEAFIELINVIIAILLAYDEFSGGEIHWYNFRYYFTLIILIYTFLSTLYFIFKKVRKMKKSSDKRKEAKAKELEKEQKAEARQKMIEEATLEKQRKAEERREAEKASMPQKDQSHKAVKKVSKK